VTAPLREHDEIARGKFDRRTLVEPENALPLHHDVERRPFEWSLVEAPRRVKLEKAEDRALEAKVAKNLAQNIEPFFWTLGLLFCRPGHGTSIFLGPSWWA
jgi:hypothetical protein